MAALPPFNDKGELPPAVHKATLTETLDRLGRGSLQREVVARRLRRVFVLARSTERVARFIVFGSFVTAKLAPNDIDVFLIMDDEFNASSWTESQPCCFVTLWLRHISAQAFFGSAGWPPSTEKMP